MYLYNVLRPRRFFRYDINSIVEVAKYLMKNFDETIAPLLERKYRIRNIQIGKPPVVRKGRSGNYKAVITPLGRFKSVSDAAEAHGVSKPVLSSRLTKKIEGYEYDVKL